MQRLLLLCKLARRRWGGGDGSHKVREGEAQEEMQKMIMYTKIREGEAQEEMQKMIMYTKMIMYAKIRLVV